MIANAGIGKLSPLIESEFGLLCLRSVANRVLAATAEDMNMHLSVNLLGVFFCLKHAAKQMIAQGRGGRLLGTHIANLLLPTQLMKMNT